MAENNTTESAIPDKKELHLIGYFSKLHGYKGELTATLDTDNIRDYVTLEHLYVEQQGHLVPFFVTLIEFKTNTTLKVRLEGINTEESAKNLVKSSIYIKPQQLSEEDRNRVALRSIVGYRVFDTEKGDVGVVSRIEEINNNPLLVINAGKKEILLPLNNDFILDINHQKKEVNVDAPEGLIDFYLEQ